jgi:hypothetical protein
MVRIGHPLAVDPHPAGGKVLPDPLDARPIRGYCALWDLKLKLGLYPDATPNVGNDPCDDPRLLLGPANRG